MAGIKDQAELEDMRRRLYERGPAASTPERGRLSDITPIVARQWPTPTRPLGGMPPAAVPVPPPTSTTDLDPQALDEVVTVRPTDPVVEVVHNPAIPRAPRHRYRLVVLALAVLALLVTIVGSGIYMYMGHNQISNKNISFTVTAPNALGGGEVLNLDFVIQNDNKVPIESAVLVINYPSGTRSVDEGKRDMLEDRISVGVVAAGEVRTVPAQAVVFGEENQQREVRASLEYRLQGSNGTFTKDITPVSFTINSSPVVVRVDSVKKVSSGQEVEVTLSVQSNAPSTQYDVLVTADYPANFDFSRAEPTPLYRENAWVIAELKPEQAATIKLRGIVVGTQDEEFQIRFAAGAGKPENQFEIGALLATAVADFVIEQPFINVGLSVNGVESEIVTAQMGKQTSVIVHVRNTLNDPLYDMAVEVGLEGNVLLRDRVNVTNGYYDSVKDVIRFDPSGDRALEQVLPGESMSFRFSMQPGDQIETPAFALTANAYARRVSERQATEQLVGTAKAEVKFTSVVTVGREAGRGVAGFTDSGPFPPVADMSTTYTVTLIAGAGGNDTTGAAVTTSLPQYVTWQNITTGDGTMNFNTVTKELVWDIGDIDAGTQKQISFQIAVLPSQNQIEQTPVILSNQRFRATDRFTGEVVRTEGAPLTTELSTEAGFPKGNGAVRATDTPLDEAE